MNYIEYDKQTARFRMSSEPFTKIPEVDKFVILVGARGNITLVTNTTTCDDILNDDFVVKHVQFKLGKFNVVGAIRNPLFIEHFIAKYTFTIASVHSQP